MRPDMLILIIMGPLSQRLPTMHSLLHTRTLCVLAVAFALAAARCCSYGVISESLFHRAVYLPATAAPVHTKNLFLNNLRQFARKRSVICKRLAVSLEQCNFTVRFVSRIKLRATEAFPNLDIWYRHRLLFDPPLALFKI